MRVSSNSVADRLLLELNRLSSSQARLSREMATGRRLLEPSDNPAAAGRVMSYESEKRMLQQFNRNADRVAATASVVGTHLEALRKITQRAADLGPIGTLTGDPQQRTTFAREIDALAEQALSLLNGQIAGNHLFGGAAVDAPPFTATRDVDGKLTGVTYGGDSGEAPGINVAETVTVRPLPDGSAAAPLAALVNHLVALREALASGDVTAMTTAQNAVLDDQDHLVAMLGDTSTVQLRVNASRAQNTARYEQLAGLASRETEADLAETLVRFKQNEQAYAAALQAGARLMQQSLLDYVR